MDNVLVNLILLAQLGAGHSTMHMSQGDHEDAMAMTAAGGNASSAGSGNTSLPTYFALVEGRNLMIVHVAMMTVSWVFVLPVAVMLSIVRSNLAFVAQILFVTIHAFAVAVGSAYNSRTPDLYPNNCHHKIGWVINIVVLAQFLVQSTGWLADVSTAWRRRRGRRSNTPGHCAHRLEMADADAAHLQLLGDTDSESEASTGGPVSPAEAASRLASITRESLVVRAGRMVSFRAWRYLDMCCRVVDRLILPLGFVAMATGVVTLGRFFEGRGIYSGLAHWIKGGVFFWLGLLTLGRWSGSFAELGWAWNLRPATYRKQSWPPSAEFVESGLIFIYGATNIFLEHLGGWGQEWSPQDLQHLSITVLFIGGGLCGMLIESSSVKTFLDTTVCSVNYSLPEPEGMMALEKRQDSEPRAVSSNPVPALVIFLLGFLMSSHHQTTTLSTMVHKQWGNLLMGASLARGLTYLLQYLRPPQSVLPSRPPTELLVSFGLIAGGIIFMASSSNTIDCMIHYELDAMFIYTITVGLVNLLMAWEILVLAIKGWAARREKRVSRMEYA